MTDSRITSLADRAEMVSRRQRTVKAPEAALHPAMAPLPINAEQTRRAQLYVIGYALKQTGSAPDAIALTRELIDELGLNGRQMRTSRTKISPQWGG